MKKFFSAIFLLLITSNISFAVEEITLENINGNENQNNNLHLISDVYSGRIENTERIHPTLRLFTKDGLVFNDSFINSLKLSFMYGGNLTFTKMHKTSSDLVYDIAEVSPGINLKFNENKSEFTFNYNIARDYEGYSNEFTHRISQLCISHKLNDNQKILIGQGSRLPVITGGAISTMDLDTVTKPQIGRNLANVRSMGIRNIADYKYIDYDIGVYDSTRYMKDFGHGLDFNGHINFKPLENISDKTGSLKLGAGYNIGDYYNSYHIFSTLLGYDYKKFHFTGEYALADGYNSIYYSKNKADGFYTSYAYDIHPKFQLVARYDFFVPNKSISDIYSQEYTLGFVYKPFENMKILLNYVKRELSDSADSNMILFATRFII